MKSGDPFEAVNSKEFLELLLGDGPIARRAFAQFFRATHVRLTRYVRQYLGLEDECQEVIQETYLAVYKGLTKFEGKSRLTTWMYSVAYYKTCDKISEKDRGHAELTDAVAGFSSTEGESNSIFGDVSPWDSASDLVAEKQVIVDMVAKAVASLPPNLQLVYRLKDEKGLSGEEIADRLQLPSSTIRVQLHRARGQIVQAVRSRLGRPTPMAMDSTGAATEAVAP